MAPKIDTKYYGQILEHGYKEAKKDRTNFVPWIVRLFGSQYLECVVKKMSEELKAALIEQHFRCKEIQACLSQGKKKLEGPFLNQWLKSKNPLISLENQEQSLFEQEKLSYYVLSLPFQETFFREKKNEVFIKFYEKIQLRGTQILYKLCRDEKPELNFKDLFCLQRTLFGHPGLLEEKRHVSWLSMLLGWKKGKEKIKEIFLLFKKSLPEVEAFYKEERFEGKKTDDFHEYVLENSLCFLEKCWGFAFTFNCRETLKKEFKFEEARLDVLYFAGVHKDKLTKVPVLQRPSQPCLLLFQRCIHFSSFFEMSNEKRSIFLECIFRTNFDLDFNYREYYPNGSSKIDIDDILLWIKKYQKEKDGFYLICYLTQFPYVFEEIKKRDLRFPNFSSLQIIQFLRNFHLDQMSQSSNWHETEDVCDFSEEELSYLSMFRKEKKFQELVEFVRKLKSILEDLLEKEVIFSFLISEIELFSIKEKIVNLVDSLCLLKERSELELQICEITNCLRSVCKNDDQLIFPLKLSELFSKKFSIFEITEILDD